MTVIEPGIGRDMSPERWSEFCKRPEIRSQIREWFEKEIVPGIIREHPEFKTETGRRAVDQLFEMFILGAAISPFFRERMFFP
jgi:hypothetical protein